jgi:hypothetical protein
LRPLAIWQIGVKNGFMLTDLSRLPSPRCPPARALRLRDRLALRPGAAWAWAIAHALVRRLTTITPVAGERRSKLRPGATTPTESPSISLRAEPLPEPPWRGEEDPAAPALVALPPLFESMRGISNQASLRPPTNIGALPTICLTPRLLLVPAARAF